jgi:regulator of cell morphogenesis and NO signaling
MMHEHDGAGEAMAQIRRLTGDYTPPDDACNTFRAMYDALKHMEQDLHRHVHKENSVLFPLAVETEARLRA